MLLEIDGRLSNYRKIREDHLADMLTHREISKARYRAGRKYQRLHEKFEASVLSRSKDMLELKREIARIEASVGPGKNLLNDVLIEGIPLDEVWDKYSEYEDVDYVFHSGLSELMKAISPRSCWRVISS
jgi:hypothetical protein